MQNRDSTYRIQKSSLGVEREIERLKIQVQMGWEKEYRNLQWYGLQNGMDILELGSGPGYFTEKLALNLPKSQITPLEIDPILMDKATQTLSSIPQGRVQLVQASVYQTELPDNSFDFAIARLLFLHLHHPVEVAKGIYRVLKPGGKLVIIDVDDGIFGVIHPQVESLHTILTKIAKYQEAHWGNRYLGLHSPDC
ncbi:class I SAM-dependent methyltransferase [Paenibacillus chungangensis]|uniref:Class I SAM-dependent methyltransferase n=1 Tax=Paenibacillus chungangensis TaxID=696535 RepID=A0ABW3HP84_9BACL